VARILPPEGWKVWLDTSRIPEVLVRFTVPGLIAKLDLALQNHR
jgi:hypothetical protein